MASSAEADGCTEPATGTASVAVAADAACSPLEPAATAAAESAAAAAAAATTTDTGCVVAAVVDAACVAVGATVATLACKPPLPTTPAFRTYDGPALKVALTLAGRLAGFTTSCSSAAEAVALWFTFVAVVGDVTLQVVGKCAMILILLALLVPCLDTQEGVQNFASRGRTQAFRV